MKLGFRVALETLTVDSVVGLHKESSEVEVIQGEDFTLYARLFDDESNLPYDVTGKTVLMRFQKDDGTVLEVTGAITNATMGIVSAPVTDTQSALLEAGTRMDVELQLDESTDRKMVKLSDCLSVVEQDF